MEHIGLVKKLARSWARTTGLEYEELEGHAFLLAVEAMNKYDPSRGAQTTYLWKVINAGLHIYCMEYCKLRNQPFSGEIQSEGLGMDPERLASFKETINNLSKEAKEVIQVLFNFPTEIFNLGGNSSSPQRIKAGLVRFLVKKGWAKSTAKYAVHELERSFR